MNEIAQTLSPFVERAKRYNSDMMLFVLNDMVASLALSFNLDAEKLKKECGL